MSTTNKRGGSQSASKPIRQQKASNQADAKPVRMPLGKLNFIFMGVCVLLIVIGFVMMAGSANVGDKFNADIFESSRTVVGPTIALIGFVLMVPAILVRFGRKDNSEPQE